MPESFLEKCRKLSSLLLLQESDNGFTLQKPGLLIEDLLYASLMSNEIWVKFSQKRKGNDYTSEDAKYDWFFDPDEVIKFQKFLEK